MKTYELIISCVEDSAIKVQSTDIKMIKNVLNKLDHEGSSISFMCITEGETAYKFIEELMEKNNVTSSLS